MSRSSTLTLLSGLLLGMVVATAATAHQSLIDACVCVVNSAARASVALAFSAALGAVLGLEYVAAGRAARVLDVAQVISFIISLFFLVQHVFFVLELA